MLGYVRFALALCVMISHTPNNTLSINPGVIAVVCFYFISGFLMRLSFERFALASPTPKKAFYIDRALKLFPQYWLVCIASFAIIQLFGPPTLVPFLNQETTPLKIILNLSLLPANYVFEPFIITDLLPHPMIPPAWSLSTEFHFYLLLPFLFTGSNKLRLFALWSSAAILIISFWFNLPAFNTATFAYRYIWGTLVFFLCGYFFGSKATGEQVIAYIVWAVFLIILIVFAVIEHTPPPLVYEVLIGAAATIPIGWLFTHIRVRGKLTKSLDTRLGALAYPMFISHFLSFYISEKLLGLSPLHLGRFFLASLLICLGVSLLLSKLQQKLDNYRISYRGFESLAKKTFGS